MLLQVPLAHQPLLFRLCSDKVEAILPLLKRGVGIHHGGLLPILKEVIEILFQVRCECICIRFHDVAPTVTKAVFDSVAH